ncbi:MAG: ATP-binding protein [Rhodospirillales bacterium]|jgi:two-component system osmolarity sensor histidine kinase EnvZ|nr:ATP-binding protein [Rhodospirillales bacterium]MDP7651362.1 ATP-binding protein [Rhodospirillales bacterium]HJO97645.1 ATP-binding protein [Rhodospirillales bacterium]
MTRQSVIKRFLPRSLLGRSLMIIVTPLVLLQVVSGFIFYESHWDKVTLRLARNLAGDIAGTITLLRQNPDNPTLVFDMAEEHMEMRLRMKKGDILPNTPPDESGLMEKMLVRAMREYVGKPFQIDTHSLDRHVVIRIQLTDSVLEVITTRKRLFSSTTYIFVLWMVGTAMILFGVAVIFMRNQVKPIRRLAFAADTFGKGRDAPSFKPEGAQEVRQAATAFIAMRDRIQRQITQRTEMLAGVSHDLRTPLTRMKLQLELLGDREGVADLKDDVEEMEYMLEGYLAFARGEGSETPTPTNLTALLGDVVAQARRKGGDAIDLHTEGEFTVPVRPAAMKRCVTNLVDNALRYADHVSVRAGRRGDAVEITIDDDGPGIPEDRRDDVFKPFFRLESSRNPVTGGVGLGLTIARDVLRGHGGEIELGDSPSGGLRARLRLPV